MSNLRKAGLLLAGAAIALTGAPQTAARPAARLASDGDPVYVATVHHQGELEPCDEAPGDWYDTDVALGDVNGDGLVDSTDALIILSADVGLNTSQFCPMNCGDVNGDGYVNSTDALIVLSYDVGMSVSFPLGQPACPSSATQPPGCPPAWIQTNWPASNSFFSLYTNQDKVFARTWDSLNGGRMFLAADDGANWTQISSADSDIDILSIVVLNSDILAGTWDGLYLSTDGGTTWNAVTPTGMPADTAIWSIAMIDTTLYAGTTGAIYESPDNGNTWTEANSGIPVDARITCLIASGDAILAGSASNGVFKTTDGGTGWTAINSGLTDTHVSQLAAMDTKWFAVTLNGVFVSDNNGMSWAADSSGLENVNCFVVVNDLLFAGTDDNGVHLSVDSGATWTSFSSGMPANTRVWSLAASSDDIFAGTDSGVWRRTVPIDTALSGDFDSDCDVDGSDLAALIANTSLLDLATFAQNSAHRTDATRATTRSESY